MNFKFNEYRWYIKLGVIILVFVILSAGIFYITSKNKTAPTDSQKYSKPAFAIPANWKVYTNKKYGFSFCYPPNWEHYEDERSKGNHVTIDSDSPVRVNGLTTSFCRIAVDLEERRVAYDNPILSFDEYVNKHGKFDDSLSQILVETADGKLKGKAFLDANRDIFFPYDGTMAFHIFYVYSNEAEKEQYDTCQKIAGYIASSIKLLK